MHSSSAEIATFLPRAARRNPAVSWPLLLGLAGFLIPALLGWGLADGDTYLHIAVGRWMLAHGHVLTHDPFSFTMAGVRCSAQEWGSDLLMAATFQAAGWSGLVFLGAVCLGATLAYLMRWLLARMEPLHALLLTLLAAMMMVPSLLVRPHMLVWPLTALWVGTLVRSSEEKRAPPWWLLIVMLVWANMHGSFMIGPGLAAMLGADAVMTAGREARWPTARRWLLFIGAALGCALVNPEGYRLLLFPFQMVSMKAALFIIPEWQPPNFEHPQVLGVWIVAIVALAFAGRIRLSLPRSLLLLGLMYMALEHVRNVALLGLISPFLLARPVAARWEQSGTQGRDAGGVDEWFLALASPAPRAVAWGAVALAGLAAAVWLNSTKPEPPVYARPSAALDAVLSRAPHARIFNDLGFGDYLIYRGVPDFVDDRIDLYGDAFLTRATGALSLAPGSDLEGLLGRYRIDAIMVGAQWAAVTLLDRLPDWQRVYSDRVVVAYVRRGLHQP